MEQIRQTFANCRLQNRSALVAYVTAGYPTVEETVDIVLGMEAGGAGEQWLSPLFISKSTLYYSSLLQAPSLQLGISSLQESQISFVICATIDLLTRWAVT